MRSANPIIHDIHMNICTRRATWISDIIAVVARLQPGLKIEHRLGEETESSRADIFRLSGSIADLRFLGIMDFVETVFRSA